VSNIQAPVELTPRILATWRKAWELEPPPLWLNRVQRELKALCDAGENEIASGARVAVLVAALVDIRDFASMAARSGPGVSALTKISSDAERALNECGQS
jgi:hypothetical protein